ncbi:hypothetical protein [Alteromonas sp. RKMC-009]|nr:hypothetical protein [Alteromonas sp. RKMC-009]
MLNCILLLACLLVIPAAQADVPEALKQDAGMTPFVNPERALP